MAVLLLETGMGHSLITQPTWYDPEPYNDEWLTEDAAYLYLNTNHRVRWPLTPLLLMWTTRHIEDESDKHKEDLHHVTTTPDSATGEDIGY